MTAIFDTNETGISLIKCEPKVFVKLLEHIYHSHEMIIEASATSFRICSHSGADQQNQRLLSANKSNLPIIDILKGTMTTGINIEIREFDVYEFRGILTQSQSSNYHNSQHHRRVGNGSSVVEEMIFCIKEVSS